MRRVAFILLTCLVEIIAWAQQPIDEATVNGAKNVLSGTVCREKTNEPIRQASVVVEGTGCYQRRWFFYAQDRQSSRIHLCFSSWLSEETHSCQW